MIHFGVQITKFCLKFDVCCFKFFEGANSCYSLYLLSTNKKDAAAIRTMEFWLKNTFTVESYIFDKKQKRSLSDKATPLRDVRFDKVNH
jgi:hypothetical protein